MHYKVVTIIGSKFDDNLNFCASIGRASFVVVFVEVVYFSLEPNESFPPSEGRGRNVCTKRKMSHID